MVIPKPVKKTKIFLGGSLLALLFPFYFLIAWFYAVQTTTGNHAERVDNFSNFFPSFLHDGFYITSIAIVCCIMAFVLGFMALPTKNAWFQAAALTVMGIASLLGIWFLFTLN